MEYLVAFGGGVVWTTNWKYVQNPVAGSSPKITNPKFHFIINPITTPAAIPVIPWNLKFKLFSQHSDNHHIN